jgi:hypothetical protein
MLERSRRANMTVEELEGRVVPTLLGQQLFPSDYPWNQNISNAPVASNSASIISHIGTSIKVHPDWGADSSGNGSAALYGIPVNVVHGNSSGVTKVKVTIDNYPGESDVVSVPMPSSPVIEGDYQNGPNPNGGGYNTGQRGDSHLIVWDEDNNVAYELYGVTRPGDKTLFPNMSGVELSHTDSNWHAAQESVWNMSSDSFRTLGDTSADAAGLSILAGLARPDEGLPTSQSGQGAINHALRFTLPSGDVNPQYIYPASHMVSTSSGSTKLPFGSRLRLMNNSTVNALIAKMGPEAQIIATAMQQYGLVLADIGSAMYVTGSSAAVDASNNISLVWNMTDVLGLSSLTAADFEVVDLTPRVTGLSATSGAAGTVVTILGQNFSGAAGHLSVFFGTTAGTSVTYVDDSHITAVVPNGSGTVNVTVQSGVNETDNVSSSPSANVNAPIFGYGTSAISSADQFTYSGAPISGSNSSDSFAASSVASGLTDTLTVTVKDTTGAVVTGLASSAFSFALSGGTSAGTFGTVTETATKGTYTATFTGTTAGTASTLTVTVGGTALTTKPTITVTPGAVSSGNSTASFASSTVASGGTDTLTVVVKDAAGNAITGLTNSAFAFALSGGTSAGTFAAVIESATKGTYTTTFTANSTAGTLSTLTVTVSGVVLTTKPTVQVTAGGISGTNSTVSFASGSVASGGTDAVTIVVKDAGGNAIAGLTNSAFGFALSGGVSAGTFSAVTATTTAGTYTATFTGTTAGTASALTATVSGVTLTTKPTVTVTPGAVSSANSTATFATSTVTSGSTDILTVTLKDAAGNAITGLANTSFSLVLSGGTSAGTFAGVIESATKGTYTTTFTGTTAGTADTLTVSVSGIALAAKPTVQVTAPTGTGHHHHTVNAIASQTVADGGTLTFAVTSTNPDSLPLTYSLASGAPSGASVAAQTGQFTWTPSEFNGIAPGAYGFTVQSAAGTDVASANFTVTVGPSSTDQGSGRPARAFVANGLTQSAEYYGNIVTAAYNKYLGRAPEASGLAYWVAQMQNGLSDEQLEAGFIGSAEFIADHGGGGAEWVQGLYQSLLGRAPQASEVQYWIDQLSAGMTPQQVAIGFAASPEREAQRVQGDYQQLLGRSAAAAEVSYWVNEFLSGASNEQVNAGFLSSQEYFQNHGGNVVDWLFASYRASLNRQPDAAGYQFWLSQLE